MKFFGNPIGHRNEKMLKKAENILEPGKGHYLFLFISKSRDPIIDSRPLLHYATSSESRLSPFQGYTRRIHFKYPVIRVYAFFPTLSIFVTHIREHQLRLTSAIHQRVPFTNGSKSIQIFLFFSG